MVDDRRLAFWGAGDMCRNMLKGNDSLKPELIIDNDAQKSGTYLAGIRIVMPQEIQNWREYYIIVVSQYEKEIFRQLTEMGLTYQKDFNGYMTLYNQLVPLDVVWEMLINRYFARDADNREFVHIVRSKEEYERLCDRHRAAVDFEEDLSAVYYKLPGKMGSYRGYCEACQEQVDFQVDYCWAGDSKSPAWRETVTCPECRCNSRMRFSIELAKQYCKNKKTFCYEQTTCTYRQLKKYIPDLTGSEYLGDDIRGGAVINGIRHEDALCLSFADESLEAMISNDVFEHVADANRAFAEACRCLKKDGILMFSVPIFKNRYQNTVRARINDSKEVVNLLLPEFHGNPLSDQGSLVFYEYGWEILDTVRNVGFSDVYALAYFSTDKGYFGGLPLYFIARK